MRKSALFLFTVLVTLFCMTVNAEDRDTQKTRVKGNNTYVSKQYNLKDFDKLSINGNLDVEFTQKQGKPEVILYTSSNLLDLIVVEVKNGKLEAGIKSGYEVTKSKYLTLRISSPTLSDIDIKGASNIDIKGKLQQENLTVKVSGAAELDAEEIILSQNMDLDVKGAADLDIDKLSLTAFSMDVKGAGDIDIKDLKADNVTATISGAGDVELKGTAKTAKFFMSGAGDIDAEDLIVNEVEARSSGIGSVTCYAKDKITAHRSGMGSIKYKGNPSVKDVDRGVKAIN